METEAPIAVRVESLKKWFGDKEVLSNVTFELQRGQILGLLGPNGAGKTTTLRIIAGVLAFDAGQVWVEGINLAHRPKEAARLIGYMPEHPPFYRELSVLAHLEFWAQLRDVPRSEIRQSVENAICAAGLQDVRGVLAKRLSKGYHQRLGLAQAIVHNPSVLVLDEPTAGLDPDQIAEARQLIRSLGRTKTLLVSTHILPDVARMCDRAVIINNGRTVGEISLPEASGAAPDGMTLLERLYLDTVHRA